MAKKRKKLERARVRKYGQPSIIERLEAFFLENVGRVATREQIQEVARDPGTGKLPENWHQRLSELRTDRGYTILSRRDTKELKVSEYVLVSAKRRPARSRVRISADAWERVLERANRACEWIEGGVRCGLKDGEKDPVGGGTVQLTPDHKTPHSAKPDADINDPEAWQALCGRHQVVKKNYWDHRTGKLNAYAIVQAATEDEKRRVFEFLKEYFGEAY